MKKAKQNVPLALPPAWSLFEIKADVSPKKNELEI